MISKENEKELLIRNVDNIIDKKRITDALKEGKPLRIKHGVDPTTPDLHLGYSVVYRKLRDFQELGHKIIFLIGDFTARFGDPTDKEQARQLRDGAEVKEMSANYIRQVGRILDLSKTEIRYNSEWYDQMSTQDFLKILAHFTYAQLIERDMFQKRIKSGKEIGLHELLYPVLQGYDSVMLKSDMTIIGTDQIFNEMRGRDLQKIYGQAPQAIVGMNLLVGTDGKVKMSQSLGNYIGITDHPSDMYGKVMSIPDSTIVTYFEMLTSLPMKEINAIKKKLTDKKENPRDLKMMLAFEIVREFHDEKAAHLAQNEFVKIFQKKDIPDDIKELKLTEKEIGIVDLVRTLDFAPSNSEARRLIQQGAVRIDHQPITDFNASIPNKAGTIIQVGRRNFAQLI